MVRGWLRPHSNSSIASASASNAIWADFGGRFFLYVWPPGSSPLNRYDHTPSDRVAVDVGPDRDDLEPACQRGTLEAVLHALDRAHDVAGGVALYRDLGIDSTAKARMPARTGSVDAAMMHHDHGAVEGSPNGVCRADISGHISIVGFRSGERSVHGVDNDRCRRPGLSSDAPD